MYKKNITLLYIIKLAKWFMLYMPVSFLFYLENNFTEQEYLLFHGVYSGVIALLEVPSGYFADRWGRKPSMVFGTAFGFIGFSVYSLSHTFYGFMGAEILLGIGASLLSGADTAILYDTLCDAGKEDRYLKTESRITAAGNIAEASAGLFVSLIVFGLYRKYFFLQTILACIAFAASLFLSEPARHRGSGKTGFAEIIGVIRYSLIEEKELRNIIIFSSIAGFCSLSMAWMAQPVFREIGIREHHFGYAWVLLNSTVSLGSLLSYRINRLLGFKGSLFYMALLLPLGFVFISIKFTLITFIPLAILFFVRGSAHPMLKNYMNHLCDSSKRATVFSIRSLIIRVLFFSFGPVLGFLSNRFSLKFALTLCGLSLLVPLLVAALITSLGGDKKMSREIKV
jgi:MFS family permease